MSIFSPQVISPPTLIATGGNISYPATIINSGGIVTNICSGVSGTGEIQTDKSLIAFPNPFVQQVNISLDAFTQQYSIAIYNIMGQVVYQIPVTYNQPGINNILLDLKLLNNGIYICKINSNEDIQTIQLIKK